MDGRSVPVHQSALFRYQLDFMRSDRGFYWRPYRFVPAADRPGLLEQNLWTARCILFCNDHIMCYYPDRFTRQFGHVQGIPPPPETHHFWYQELHGTVQDRLTTFQNMIQNWNTRVRRLLPPRPCIDGRAHTTAEYDTWYDGITRHFVVNPAVITAGYGWTGVHDLQLDRPAARSRPHVRTGRGRGRPHTTAVPLQPGDYFTSVGQEVDEEDGEQQHDHWFQDLRTLAGFGGYQQEQRFTGGQSSRGGSSGGQQEHEFFQGQSSMGGFTGGYQQEHGFTGGQSSMGGFTGGYHQDQGFTGGQSSMGGFTGGYQQDQGFTGGFDSPLRTPPPDVTQTQDEDDVAMLSPWRSPPQTQDTRPQEQAHAQGKGRRQHSYTPLSGFLPFAGPSSAFLTPPPDTQEEEEEDEPPRRAPPRAARRRGRRCGTGSHFGGQH